MTCWQPIPSGNRTWQRGMNPPILNGPPTYNLIIDIMNVNLRSMNSINWAGLPLKHSFSLFFYVATHAIYMSYIYAISMENWRISPLGPLPTQLVLAKKSAAARCHMAHVLQDGPGGQFQLLPGGAIFPWPWSLHHK